MTVTACSGPGYYLQAATGHWKLMRSRQDIAGVLADPATEPALVQKLETARRILDFAEAELGLPAKGSYTTLVETHGREVAWNVVATPEFSLEPRRWCFLVAGCVPYRAYFEEDDARRAASRLAARGLDVAVTPVAAYSTLGWFPDPLLDTMLERNAPQLAALLLHELAHQRVYLRGDTGFNETYASFVESAGVRKWLRNEGAPEEAVQWEERLRARRVFNQLLRETRAALGTLYRSGAEAEAMRRRKQEIIGSMEERYRYLRDGISPGDGDHYSAWFRPGVNNAHLALAIRYEGGFCAFARLFQDASEDFHVFHELVESRGKLNRSRRKAWLGQGCDPVASAGEL